MKDSELLKIDPEFEEITEGEDESRQEKLKTKWAALEAVVGSETRIKLIAKDLVEHFERRTEAMDGKAMIVCMSRRICVELYNAIIALRPQWHDEDDLRGAIKIVMTGSASDNPDWQQHSRNKPRRREHRCEPLAPTTLARMSYRPAYRRGAQFLAFQCLSVHCQQPPMTPTTNQRNSPELSGKNANPGLPLKRRERDSNPRYPYGHAGFQDRCIQPLCHLSERIDRFLLTNPADGRESQRPND